MKQPAKSNLPTSARLSPSAPPEPSRARDNGNILTINGGSSSIRFALFDAAEAPRKRLSGKIDRIGASGTTLLVAGPDGQHLAPHPLPARSHQTAIASLLDWLEAEPWFATVQAVAHRVVHGMRHCEPERVTAKLLAELRRITPYAPDHLPREIALIEAIRKRHPKLPQVAAFDTAFHRTMPRVARMLPIPRRYAADGVERYGFHGLSYTYLMDALRAADPAVAKGRVILAHLGHGASLAAVLDGRSVDTSMGFTPAAGLMMSTRTGDVDPGLIGYLSRAKGLTAVGFEQMANHESGLLGVSGTSSDLRDLLAREEADGQAADAIALFCYQAKKWIGSFSAVLGGLDALVFAGGIGENAPVVRARICEGLGFLGVKLDNRRNARNAAIISASGSPVRVHVITTDEELVLAKLAIQVLGLGGRQGSSRAR